MKRASLLLPLLLPLAMLGQQAGQQPPQQAAKKDKTSKHWKGIGLGVKAGLNFANVTNAGSINSSTRAGFHAGLFFEPSSRIIGSRTELIYSQHGFNYKAATADASVNLDYIELTQMMAINITSYVELMLGGYTAYLLHVKNDSGQISTGNAAADQLLSYYNRFDYGFGGGGEIHPVLGLLIGARYNLSFSNLFKQNTGGTAQGQPSYIPYSGSPNFKNNVVQLFVGYRF